MISILIPVYNFNISDLVHGLVEQIKDNSIEAEIIIVDDSSSKKNESNSELQNLLYVKFEQLTQNIGRSKIRNYLASKSRYNYLLFIDCDAGIYGSEYLKNYIQCIYQNNEVACGGTIYQEKAPEDRKLFLHWFYGKNREMRSSAMRAKNPYNSFSTFNFLIKKEIFTKIKFNEDLIEYGHEDTLFGIELKRRGTEINHITNPLIHEGLDLSTDFISKTNKSVYNLRYLYENYPERKQLLGPIKLLRYAQVINNLGLAWFFKMQYHLLHKKLIKSLISNNPSLILLDIYKLLLFFSF
ncbi:MAG: hypothetical protein C0597_11230 [Marinilabiliales bacterium]|nr:MAG: hypothetical protein C0597_11230 [Marinilabiliales bacterium]